MTAPIFLGGAASVAALAYFACSNRLCIKKYRITSEKITHPIRFAQISDLHECRYGDGQRELLSALHAAKPDVIVITGDIIEDDDADDPRDGPVLTTDNPSRPLLEAAPRIAPTYMVFGNHESNLPRTDLLCEEIDLLGVQMLHRNDPDERGIMHDELTTSGDRVLICGADDPYFDRREKQGHLSLSARFHEDASRDDATISGWRARMQRDWAHIAGEKRLTVLLSHRPEEFALYGELAFDAVFSGHAHGGQWRIPYLLNGVYAPHQGMFPKHAGGFYQCGRTAHIVSRGLSKKRMVRIFNRPEVCILDILPDEKNVKS